MRFVVVLHQLLQQTHRGGIINIVSKTGEGDEGSVATTIGLDYDSTRTDFQFGGEINDSTYFHIGGFYRKVKVYVIQVIRVIKGVK